LKTRQQNTAATYGSVVTFNATYRFDAYGNQVKVISAGQTVWELTGAEGKVTTTRLGGSMTATRTLDSQGFLTSLKTMKGSTVIRNMGYQFNAATGNLTWRTGMISQKENFEYDLLDRLKSVKEGVALLETMAINFHPNGNILSKTGLGIYGYHTTKVHAVENVDFNSTLMPSTLQSISYTAFNKATRLKEIVVADSMRLDIMYGPDEQRWKSILKKNGSDQKTIIFAGDYEKVTENGVVRELYYIGAPDGLAAVYVKNAIQGGRMYYAHTDHQGSIVSLTDSIGGKVFQASYDAWGKQSVSLNTIGFYRGYTGHEHLPEFGLINMNGRMYDPVLGRFLSPDNYVQGADNSQSFNRYSYCINNPLKYTDPTGDFFWIIPNISFSPNGGLNFDVTFGVGIPGVFGGQLTVGGGAGGFNISAGGFIGPANAYVGYSKNGGFMAGAGLGFGGLPNGFNTNMTGLGVNYSSNGGLSFNISGSQFDTHGNVSMDPSIGWSHTFSNEAYDYVEDGSSSISDKQIVPYSDGQAKQDLELMQQKLGDTFRSDLISDYTSSIETKAPAGHNYTVRGKYINRRGEIILGRTEGRFFARSKVYLSSSLLNADAVDFRAIAGHELIHARHNFLNLNSINFSERAAYKFTSDVYMQNGRYSSANGAMSTAMYNSQGNFWGAFPSAYNVPYFYFQK